jgi:TRAP-type C4-dicarboxylate transport system substrate-binding protein
MKRSLVILAACLTLGTLSTTAMAGVKLKLASLAPAKSTWTKYLKKMAKELKEKTGGEVTVELYVGGVQGDEKEVIEKVKTGQLHMAAITAVGLSKIVPDALIFQVPGLYGSAAKMDKVRNAVSPQIAAKAEAEGFKLLGWSDVGPNYFFTNNPVTKPSDLKAAKMWVWTDDPIAQSIVRNAGGSGRPMGVPSVTAALANGKIDGYMTSPLAAASLRWYNRSTHIMSQPISMGIGAIVMSKPAYDSLSESARAVMTEMSKKWTIKLTKKVRSDNKKLLLGMAGKAYEGVSVDAGGALKVGASKAGATKPVVTHPGAADQAAWRSVYLRVQNELAGKIYSKALLDRVRGLAK